MKITALTTYRVAPRWMFLKIETDEGISGWGEPVLEGRALTVETAVREFGTTLIGKDRRAACGRPCTAATSTAAAPS